MSNKPKRHWLRFSVRGLLILTVIAAIGMWLISPKEIEYHQTTAGMELDLLMGYPGTTANYTVDRFENPSMIDRLVHYNAKIVYVGSYRKATINQRIEWRTSLFYSERIDSSDTDGDGIFDLEEHDFSDGSFYGDRSLKIHIPVPKIEP